MNTQSEHYREMAAAARSEAEAAALPNVQEVHLRSAERLDQMVQNMENVAKAKVRNDDAKAAELQDRGGMQSTRREP